MNNIIKIIQNTINKESLLKKNNSLLLSFSGGSDSIFLLNALITLGYKNINLIYFNHNLRVDEELSNEIEFCKIIAKKHNLKLKIKSLPINAFKKKFHSSTEEAARFLRRSYLKHYAHLKKINIVLMAHHYDDQIETILMRYQKGTYKFELPLKFRSKLSENVTIIRPLINIKKKTILNYLKSNQINYSFDSTNKNNIYLRNKIRNDWIPVLKLINPNLITLFHKSSEIFSQINSKYENNFLIQKTKHEHKIKLSFLSSYNQNIIYKFINDYYMEYAEKQHKLYFSNVYITSKHIYNVKNLLIDSQAGKYIDLPNNQVCYKGSKNLYLTTKKELNKNIKVNKQIKLGKQELLINDEIKKVVYKIIKQKPKSLKSSKNHAYLAVSIKNDINIRLRNINKNDEFIPFGSLKKKKVSDYLENKKCDWYNRKKITIIEINNKIAWIVGYTISEEFKIQNSMKNNVIIKLSIHS
tara:strand:+ start:1884 stop:3290 length:1407 start_codon:yes stop_codon:yes gene_type:complete